MTSKKLVNARCRVLIKQPWYGSIISRFKYIESNSISTIGVRIVSVGCVECLYNINFVESLEVNELIAVLCHEVEHIIRMHPSRRRFIKSPDVFISWNIACDWVINGYKNEPNIANLPKNGTFIPRVDDSDWSGCNFKHFPECGTAEQYFKWLNDNIEFVELKINGNNNNDNNGNGCQIPCRVVKIKGKNGKIIDIKIMDDHDIWNSSKASEEEIRRTAKDLAKSATSMAGKAPGGLVESIQKLNKPKENWVFKWKHILGRSAGNKRKTFARRNRRDDRFGIKGISRHASIPLIGGVDTSASMSTKMLEKVFTEVESMSQHFKITLVQFDVTVNHVSEYHRGDWKKIKIHGRGGTNFSSFFDYIEKHKMIGKMNFIVTDGFDLLPKIRDYPVTWIIIGKGGHNHLKNQGNLWGDVIVIDHDYQY